MIAPQIADQPYWARRVADLGIGAAHERPAIGIRSFAAVLATALGVEIRARAAAMAGAIRADGAATAAKLLLDAVGR